MKLLATHIAAVQEGILAAVRASPGIRTRDLDIQIRGGTPPEAVSRAVSAMVKAGLLRREGRGRLYLPVEGPP